MKESGKEMIKADPETLKAGDLANSRQPTKPLKKVGFCVY
jgi:hypothetical protein